MTDADLIYNAILRAERKLEEWPERDPTLTEREARLLFLALNTLRIEIGRGIAETYPQ